MKYFLVLCLLIGTMFISRAQEKTLKGKVSDGENFLKNVKVSIIDKGLTTTTDNNGHYELLAEKEDIVSFSMTNMETLHFKIEDVTSILNTRMIPKVTFLENVTVEAEKIQKRNLEKEYVDKKSIIKTTYGYIDSQVSTMNVQVISRGNIRAATCILGILDGTIAGIKVSGDCVMGGSVTGRNGAKAIFDIDGRIFNGVPTWLNTSDIKRMAVLNGYANASYYSTLGLVTVVIINTSLSVPSVEDDVDNFFDINMFFDSPILTSAQVLKNAPTYLMELKESISIIEAKKIFGNYIETYKESPYFILDTYGYFYDDLAEIGYADSIIESSSDVLERSPVILKALAYMYEAQGRPEKANIIYKKVLKERPNYAQSYFDMANSYREVGNIQKAASIYARYDYLLREGFLQSDTIGFSPIIKREYENLRNLTKTKLIKKDLEENLLEPVEKGETRVVFEWNDSEAEFELKFMDPFQKYYDWKHSLSDNKESVLRSKNYGYNLTEKVLDPSSKGNWKLYVKYLGNKSLTPTYLKITIYHNYGTLQQSKEVKVFKMFLKMVNHELLQIDNENGLVFEM